MAPYREPVFSQGRAWLPPWLAASSLQSDAALSETPSMFATSWKDLDETVLSSSAFKDITNKSFTCLHLSNDTSIDTSVSQGIEDCKLENKLGAFALQCSQQKDLVLQLSLSQTQATTDTNLKCGLIFKPEAEAQKNSKSDVNIVVENEQEEDYELVQNFSCSERALKSENDKARVMEKSSVSPAAARSAELVNPVVQQFSQIRGKHKDLSGQGTQLQLKRPAEMIPSNVSEGKKLKFKNMRAVNEDVQAAIGLTVATAETLVIADILNGCQMCQCTGPEAILDAAIMLRKEREAIGLDFFTLEDIPCKTSFDQEWDVEDLDDTNLEAEFRGVQTIGIVEAPSGNHCKLVDMEETESLLKAENASATVGLDGHPEATTSLRHQTLCEERQHDALGVVQRPGHVQPVQDKNGDEDSIPRNCIGLKLVVPKDSFNSRWFGGWTGVNRNKDKQAGHSHQQADKKRNELCKFETSDLSESYDLPSVVENLLRCSKNDQNKGSDCAVTSMPEVQADALSAGSCAEILLALSQASVKCSPQDPLCSFVPCSVNAHPRSSTNELAKWNGFGSNNEMAAGSMENDPVSGSAFAKQNLMVEQHPVQESFPTEGVKRLHLNSLQSYSTNPPSLLVESMMQTTEKQLSKTLKDLRENLCVNCDQKDQDESCVLFNKRVSSDQCKLILQDSDMQDSPPLIWNRGKRRRLRACRVAESDLTNFEGDDITCGFLPGGNSAVTKAFAEPGILCHEDCAGFDQATLPTKNDAQLPSLDKHMTNTNLVDARPGVQQDRTLITMENVNSPSRLLEEINTESKVQNLRGRGSTSSLLFSGMDFLLTGFPASQKILCEEVTRKIQEHGGVILSSVPNFLSLARHKTASATKRHSIIIAPQKVRTLKYLYGCAAGLLIVKPNWLDEYITTKKLLFKHKPRGRGSMKQIHMLCLDEIGKKDLIFSKVAAFLHGQRSYCSKLSLLIQHGGGKVFRSVKSLALAKNVKISFIQIVVAEHHSSLPQIVKETAASSGFCIVSGDWIINSLLDNKLVSLPTARASAEVKSSIVSKGLTANLALQKKVCSAKKRESMRNASSLRTAVANDTILQCKKAIMDEPCVSFLGKGAAMPALSRMGLPFILEPPASIISKELRSGQMFYKAACINGIIYSAGDIVEVRPEEGEEKEPYIAQIESFYAAHSGSVKTRSAGAGSKRQPRKVCFLCCRWFYRPSDTGFPCMGTGKELYLSQHFDDRVPIDTLIRRVQMMLFVDGKAMINDTEKGWKVATETLCAEEAADYVCRFFYDYHKESLHQLKAALTS